MKRIKKKVNIAIVVNSAWNVYNFRISLIKFLLNEGHHVLVLAPKDAYSDQIRAHGVSLIELKFLSRKGSNPFIDYKFYRELKSIFLKEKIELVLQFTIKPNIYGSLAANALNIKSISTVTGLGFIFLNSNPTSFVAKQLYKYAFSQCSRIIFQNIDDRELFLRNNLVSPLKTYTIDGSGVDTNYFHPSFNTCPSNPTFNILFAGRLLIDKGIREMMEAIKQLESKKIQFTLIGDVDRDNPATINQNEFDSWLKNRKNVHYIRQTDDIRSHIGKSDLVVLPSYREGVPRILLEAMSMEKPIITTDVPGCKDTVIPGMNGILIPPKSVKSLINAINHLAQGDQSDLQKMGIQGRKIVIKRFDEKIILNKYLQHIHQVMGFKHQEKVFKVS